MSQLLKIQDFTLGFPDRPPLLDSVTCTWTTAKPSPWWGSQAQGSP